MKQNSEKAKYSSNYPISIIFGLVLDFLILSLFGYHIFFEELPILEGILFSTISLVSVHLIICPNAGKITLDQTRLTIKYFFIWNSNYEIETNEILNLETRRVNKYRFDSKIYLTLNDNSIVSLNIQSWYGSILGVEIVEQRFKEFNVINGK